MRHNWDILQVFLKFILTKKNNNTKTFVLVIKIIIKWWYHDLLHNSLTLNLFSLLKVVHYHCENVELKPKKYKHISLFHRLSPHLFRSYFYNKNIFWTPTSTKVFVSSRLRTSHVKMRKESKYSLVPLFYRSN